MDAEEKEVSGNVRGWEWFAARAHGPHAIAWLSAFAFLEPIVIPLAPESLMIAMILAGRERWKKYAAITTIASTLGCIAGYFIGAFLFKEFGVSILSYYGLHRWFHAARVLLAGNIFFVMLLVMLVPIPDKVFVILAGFFHVPLLPYVAGFFCGRSVRVGSVAYLTHRFGGHVIGAIKRYFEVLAAIVLIIFIYAVLHALLFHIAGV